MNKQMKAREKMNQGITLIALVITIIVLLILTGVTIATLTGENSLINKAKEAKTRTEMASIKEEIQIEILGKQAENGGNLSEDTLKMILEKYGVLSDEEKLLDKTLTTTEGNYKIKVSELFKGTTVEDIPDKNDVEKPNVEKFAQKTYVTWELNETGTEYVINDEQTTQPDNWYDYENGKWANIKTTNETEGLEAYWVWIPRYEYVVPTSTTATEIAVRFIGTDKKEGTEGYTKQSDGTIKSSDGYTIHPAFTNEGNGGLGELDGIWVAKFEAVSNTPTADYGGGNSTSLKIQVIPNQPSWRFIRTQNIFTICRKMTNEGEVLEGSSIDSHMIKNMEWGAVAILSQSKYGVYNPESMNGKKGNNEYQIWNNPSSSYITGSVGTDKDATRTTTTSAYNSASGPKASTTGTVYGVYDMAGGAWEYVAGCINGQENAKFGVTVGDTKYVDLYTNSSTSNSNYNGAKIGDATRETKNWNHDNFSFVTSSYPMFQRGRFFPLW